MNKLTKSKFAAAVIIAVMLLSVFAVVFTINFDKSGVASADSPNYGVADQIFINTVEDLAECDVNSLITSEKEFLYDINLNTLGYIYNFDIDGTNGYAVMTNSSGYYEIDEIYFDAVNPYEDVNGTPVYFTYMTYAYYSDGSFYWMNDRKIGEAEFDRMTDYLCYSGGSIILEGENIPYTNRSEIKHEMVLRHPFCYEIGDLLNSCVAIAGTNIIEYFDRFNENLLPNFTSYSVLYDQFIYYSGPTDETDAAMRQLYADMDSTPSQGATITNFKNGMIKYCARKNLSISYSSCMNDKSFNYALTKQKLETGFPVVVFVNKFYMADITKCDTSDTINYLHGDGRHAMAGFGYKEITYTLTSGGTRTDKYIQVASGISLIDCGFYNISKGTTVEEVLAINIY